MKILKILGSVLVSFMCRTSVQSQKPNSEVKKLSLDEFEELFETTRLADAERRLRDKQTMHEAEQNKKIEDLDSQRAKSRQVDNDSY